MLFTFQCFLVSTKSAPQFFLPAGFWWNGNHLIRYIFFFSITICKTIFTSIRDWTRFMITLVTIIFKFFLAYAAHFLCAIWFFHVFFFCCRMSNIQILNSHTPFLCLFLVWMIILDCIFFKKRFRTWLNNEWFYSSLLLSFRGILSWFLLILSSDLCLFSVLVEKRQLIQ